MKKTVDGETKKKYVPTPKEKPVDRDAGEEAK